ncbi:MAG: DegT/DnrJ/EryC1/StrS family aminotransferase [Euryarchaeota archaeon]|nr:DegT/DnrJ/EryC1/StrS family aminotransferase [Euryarchaeota archaeon]
MIDKEEIEAVTEVLKSGMLAQGEKVELFEKKFSEFIGTQYGIAVSSGTTALITSLLAHKIKKEVITTPFTFISSVNSIIFTGGRPVFVDINEEYNIDLDKVHERITPKTEAVMPVHLYGNPCDMAGIMDIVEDHDLILIEDACQAHGAQFNGKKAGSFGTGCFSFYPTKNITTGEGGMITTDNKKIAEKCRLIRNIGMKNQYEYVRLGYNFRMTEMAAAIGIEQLKKIDSFIEQRRKNAKYLTKELKEVKGIVPPTESKKAFHVYHQYTIRVTEEYPFTRDGLQKKLKENEIGSKIYYPLSLNTLPLYNAHEECLHAEQFSREVLSLPIHPSVTKEDLDLIAEVIRCE